MNIFYTSASSISKLQKHVWVGLIMALFFFASQGAKAQFREMGILGGFSFSNVVGADVSGNGIRIGLHLGGYAQFELEEKWGLRPEILLYSQKGTSSGGFSTAYLEIPLMATYSFDDKFRGMFGVQPSFLYNASVSDGRGDITREIRTVDLGLVVGGWYQINERWGVGARIVRGFSKVGQSGEDRTYNANFQLSIGYRFR